MKALNRKPKAQVAKQFVGVLQRTQKKQPRVLLVPGSDGKQYNVIIRRYNGIDPFVSTECRLQTGNGYMSCPGNTFHSTLCYHSLAAVDFCLSESKLEGAWCKTYEDALKLNQIKKGKIIKVKSHQSKVEMFVVVSKLQLKQLSLGI